MRLVSRAPLLVGLLPRGCSKKIETPNRARSFVPHATSVPFVRWIPPLVYTYIVVCDFSQRAGALLLGPGGDGRVGEGGGEGGGGARAVTRAAGAKEV